MRKKKNDRNLIKDIILEGINIRNEHIKNSFYNTNDLMGIKRIDIILTNNEEIRNLLHFYFV